MKIPVPNIERELEFFEIINTLPKRTLRKLEQLKILRERPDFHPESSAFEHVKIVTCRLISTGNRNLIASGIFHDITKLDEAKINPKNGFPTSPGHDKSGAEFSLREENKNWIIEFGADPETVAWICENHMRIQQINEMKPKKQEVFRSHQSFQLLEKFTSADKMNIEWPEETRVDNISFVHLQIMDELKNYLSQPGNNYLRFTQALFNLGINEFASLKNPEEMKFLFRDNHNDCDTKILHKIKQTNESINNR